MKKTRRGKKQHAVVQTKYGAHLCEFIPDPEGKGYTVVAKHVPGVVTEGRTLQEAKRMAKEALELCIECLVEESIPRKMRRVSRRVPVAARV